MVDQRLVIGGIVAAVLLVAWLVWMANNAGGNGAASLAAAGNGAASTLFSTVHGIEMPEHSEEEMADMIEMVHPGDVPAVQADRPVPPAQEGEPTSMMKEFPGSRSGCGEDGDVTNCPKHQQPTMVGEHRAVYAIHNGTLHDPRLNRDRFSKYKPNLLSSQPQHEMEHPWEHIAASVGGPGHELQAAYGYNMRQALIAGNSPRADEL